MTSVQPNPTAETSCAGAASHHRLNPINVPPSLVTKVYDMVDDPSTDAIISWGPDGKSLVISDQKLLAETLLPKYFKHNNLLSFIRQLNHYGFRKVSDRTKLRTDPNIMEYTNDHFVRGQPHLLKNMTYKKRKPPDTQHQPQPQNATSSQLIELGNYGGLKEEIDMLKRDKNILVQELIKLKQQQQSTNNHIQTMFKKIQIMAHRQQLMMSFMAKAMQHPGLFTQFLQQQNENSISISKKRRLSDRESDSSCGQMVKYQPFIDGFPMLDSLSDISVDDSGNTVTNDVEGVVPPSPVLELLNGMQGIEDLEEFISVENCEKQEDAMAYFRQIEAELDDFTTPIEVDVDDDSYLDIMNELMGFGEGNADVQSVDLEMQQMSSVRCENAVQNVDNLAVQMGLLASDSKG